MVGYEFHCVRAQDRSMQILIYACSFMDPFFVCVPKVLVPVMQHCSTWS